MVDLATQRASAVWLIENGAYRPIVVTFYAVGTYELLSDGIVRPVYAFPLVRHPKQGPQRPDYVAVWRTLLAGAEESRFIVMPVGENPVEQRHFDELAIREALLQAASGTRVAVFSNRRGDPLLEIWQVKLADGLADRV
jgi:hypothetical protein